MPSQPSQHQVPCDWLSIDGVLGHVLDRMRYSTPAQLHGFVYKSSRTSHETTLRPTHGYHNLRRCCFDISHPEHAILHTPHLHLSDARCSSLLVVL